MTLYAKHGVAELSKVKVARAMCIRGRQIIEEGMMCVCVCVCVCVCARARISVCAQLTHAHVRSKL